jgi:hypothetical protein
MTRNNVYLAVMRYIDANPSETRPYVIKTSVGLKPTHSMYKGLLWRMEKQGLLRIEGAKAFGTRRWVVLKASETR